MPVPPKLLWSCRRGMLELDILFKDFLSAQYDQLTPSEQEAVVHLLAQNDQDLYRWLFGELLPPDPELAIIIKRMKSYAQSKL